MAYNIFPKSKEDIQSLDISDDIKEELIDLLIFLQNKYNIEDPISLDLSKIKKVKIIRALQTTLNLSNIKSKYSLDLSFGNGSRGNRGLNNTGLQFEVLFTNNLLKYVNGNDKDIPKIYLNLFDDMLKLKIFQNKIIKNVKHIGSSNNKRKLKIFNNKLTIENTNNTNQIISDVIIETNKNDIYCSLKYGNTVTLINTGIKQYIPTTFFNGKFTNEGKLLLNFFEIDINRFVNIFTNYKQEMIKQKFEKDIVEIKNTNKIKDFLRDILGVNYLYIHFLNNKYKLFYIDDKFINKLLSGNGKGYILYPKDNTVKRIDIKYELPNINVKFNIRSKDGSIYPTHLTADYKILMEN